MGSFSLTNKAKEDLKSIAAYTQRKWGKQQRRIYAKSFDDVLHVLAENPNIGNQCDYIKTAYKKFPNTSHVIFYRIIGTEKIEIVRILHKKMDAREKLSTS